MSDHALNETDLQTRLARRDATVWRAHGRMLLFIAAIASLLFALVTFVAHNWVYLSTVGKLAGLSLLLIISAALWVWRKFDDPVAQALGITAQMLIGIWLAAAGQLYQAPGELADLLEIWVVLGLPFALAARSSSHWAVWLTVLFGATVGLQGAWAQSVFGHDFGGANMLVPPLIFSAAFGLAAWTKAPAWLLAAIAAAASALMIAAMIYGVMDDRMSLTFVVAAALTLGTTFTAYHYRPSLGSLSLLSIAALSVIVIPVTRFIFEISDMFAIFLLLTVLFGGATFTLVRLFSHFRPIFPAETNFDGHATDSVKRGGSAPWYMDVAIALGGMLTAVFGAFFVGSVLGLILSTTIGVGVALMVIGLPLYGGALWLRLKKSGPFLDYLFGTLILIGGGCAIGGVGAMFDSFNLWPSAVVAIGLAVPVLILVPSRVMQCVQALIISLALAYLCAQLLSDYSILAVEATTFAGLSVAGLICLYASQTGRDFLVATAIFFFMPMVVLGYGSHFGITQSLWADPTMAMIEISLRVILIGTAVAVLKISPLGHPLPAWSLLILLVACAGLLPVGAGASLLLLLTGYALGSRSFFLIGGLASLWYMLKAYYDLGFTLMELSLVTALCGMILLAVWRWLEARVT